MTESPQITWSTFIVRLSNETGSGEWRGQITHVQSGESRYFVTLAQLEEFLRRHVPDFGAESEGRNLA